MQYITFFETQYANENMQFNYVRDCDAINIVFIPPMWSIGLNPTVQSTAINKLHNFSAVKKCTAANKICYKDGTHVVNRNANLKRSEIGFEMEYSYSSDMFEFNNMVVRYEKYVSMFKGYRYSSTPYGFYRSGLGEDTTFTAINDFLYDNV